jgi:putative ABC transport system permease protein
VTSRPDVEPPRLAERVVRLAIRDARWREITLGDLGEEFGAVLAARGPGRARRWYWRQAVGLSQEAVSDAILSVVRVSGGRPMRTFIREVRLATRSMYRQPLVASLVLATLALGLGANAATFGMIDHLLLKPFTIANVDRMVVISENSTSDPFARSSVAPGNFEELRKDTSVLARWAAFDGWTVNMSGGDQPEAVQGDLVTADFFAMVGTTPALGRLIGDADMGPGRARQVVIGDGLWQRRFGADPGIVGRTIQLDGDPYTVVGVAAKNFSFPEGAEIWAPLAFTPELAADHAQHYLTVIGDLRPGATLEETQAGLALAYERIRQRYPDGNRDRALVVRTFVRGMVDEGMPQILVLWQAAAALVLLIACANIANLLLARGAERRREIAVRLAVGASRGQIVRQLLIESLVLATVSVPLALGVAVAIFRAVEWAMPAELLKYIPGFTEMGIDARVVAFTLAVSFGTAILFGLLPALQASRPGLVSALKDGGRSVSVGAGRSRLRKMLVVAQVAVALPLLVSAGLSAIGSHRFANGPQGYTPEGTLRIRTILPEKTYPDAAARGRFAARLLEEARTVPGVAQAATTTVAPSSSWNKQREVVIDGVPSDPNKPQIVNFRAVSPGYLATMEIPILRGREFDATDNRADGARVALVSEAFARKYWPDQVALGRRLKVGRDSTEWITVVGVTGDTIDDWFISRRAPTIYRPVAQSPSASVILVARTDGNPESLADGLRQALARVDPDQPAVDVTTGPAALRQRTTGLRFIAGLMAGFGVLALVLAAFGIYGVMAHYVAQRRHEIGVRMALGASRRDVLRLTLGQGLRLAAVGIALGLAFGLGLARLMESALFGIVSAEPSLFVAITAALAGVALGASLLPARHATRVDPMVAMREN